MRNPLFYRPSLLCIGILIALLTGCAGSTPARFYTLSALKNPEPPQHAVSQAPGIIVSIGPLSIPDYLDRPQIVTRSGVNELDVNDYHRWAGSLQNDMSRVLIENLSVLLPPDRYHVVGWLRPAEFHTLDKYRVTVDIIQFDGRSGDAVSMKAHWAIFRKDRDTAVMDATVTEQINGNDYPALVDAMSRSMEALSRTIADTISSFAE